MLQIFTSPHLYAAFFYFKMMIHGKDCCLLFTLFIWPILPQRHVGHSMQCSAGLSPMPCPTALTACEDGQASRSESRAPSGPWAGRQAGAGQPPSVGRPTLCNTFKWQEAHLLGFKRGTTGKPLLLVTLDQPSMRKHVFFGGGLKGHQGHQNGPPPPSKCPLSTIKMLSIKEISQPKKN